MLFTNWLLYSLQQPKEGGFTVNSILTGEKTVVLSD